MTNLKAVVDQLLVPGKGILAADESTTTANKRLRAAGVEPSEEMRRQYRQLLFATPGLKAGLSGVILFEETLKQSTDEGQKFVDLLTKEGIIPGIKTDQGLIPLGNSPSEQISKGLKDLSGRNQQYFKL